MRSLLFLLLLLGQVWGQQPTLPGQQPAPSSGQQPALPSLVPIPPALPPGLPPAIVLTYPDALERAKRYSLQAIQATYNAVVAREQRIQARDALLPTISNWDQFIYTQPNGTPTGVFIAANGPHEYISWMVTQGDIYSPLKLAERRRAIAAQAVARARWDIANRGLIFTVAQNYYAMVGALRKVRYYAMALNDALRFVDITTKQEAAGEVSHADVVRAELLAETRRIELQNARAEVERTRITFSVILFPDYLQNFAVVDDLETAPKLPTHAAILAMATNNNPEIRAAMAMVEEQKAAKSVARSELLPHISAFYIYGIDSNFLARRAPLGRPNVGSQASAQMNLLAWNWGAVFSRIRAANYRLQQARAEYSLTERQLLANVDAFYVEASTAAGLLANLRHAVDLAAEAVRLFELRYEAGESDVLLVVDAQNALLLARNGLVDGLVRYRVAIANLQVLTGIF